MNCLEAVKNFSAYYEDLLDYESLKHFETHISACSECQREYDQFFQAIKVTQELPEIEPSSFFLTTLEHKLVGKERDSITLWERISRLFKMPHFIITHFNITQFNIMKRALTVAVVLLMVAATFTVVFRDDVLDRENQTNVTNSGITSESQNIDSNELFTIETGSDFSSIGVSPLMQQNYTLKQVSYSTVSIGGGL